MHGGKYKSDKDDFGFPQELRDKFEVNPRQYAKATKQNTDQYGHLVKLITPREYFGELALMKDSAKRGASAVCATNSDFLIVSGDKFRAVVEVYKREQKLKEEFLQNLYP